MAVGAQTLDRETAPALAHVQARLATLLGELREAEWRLRLQDDPEDVHRMRVATRRLRSLLRTTRPMFDRGWTDAMRRELDFLAGALGAVRDLDVLIAHIDEESARLDAGDAVAVSALPRTLREQRRRAFANLREVLESERYLALLDSLERAAHDPPVATSDFDLEQAARKEFRRFAKRARFLTETASDGALHKLRIRGKRARYAAELAEPVTGPKAKRFVKRAKRFQDVLGEHQDAVVAEREIRELARNLPHHAASLAAGRLIARERERRDDVRKHVRAEWKRLDRAGKAAWR
jgi:CHAD domain-containing protein